MGAEGRGGCDGTTWEDTSSLTSLGSQPSYLILPGWRNYIDLISLKIGSATPQRFSKIFTESIQKIWPVPPPLLCILLHTPSITLYYGSHLALLLNIIIFNFLYLLNCFSIGIITVAEKDILFLFSNNNAQNKRKTSAKQNHAQNKRALHFTCSAYFAPVFRLF